MKKQNKTKQKPKIAKTILNNKRTAEGLIIPNFKLYFIAIVKKTAWYWHKSRHVAQRNQTEDTDINLNTYEYLFFLKSRIQKYTLGKRQYLEQMVKISWHVEEYK